MTQGTVTTIIRVAVPCHIYSLLDYHAPPDVVAETLQPGFRVLVPFRKKNVVGFIIEIKEQSEYAPDKIRSALEILDTEATLSAEIIKLCRFASDYYHYPIGEVFAKATPKLLRARPADKPARAAKKNNSNGTEVPISSSDTALTLTEEQINAITRINDAAHHYACFLLYGVTGSGKTEVYLESIKHCLNRGQQALVLIPEISLTPQTVARFTARFNKTIGVIHSQITPKQKIKNWQEAQKGIAGIIIGTRSAVFTPFKKLGLIIVDEEHDLSFKQQEGFHYSARDLAIYRAHQQACPIVIGSATPSLESWWHAEQGRYQRLTLSERPGDITMPSLQIVNLIQQRPTEGIAHESAQQIKAHLAANQQVLLFLNRRGFSPSYFCTTCQWIAKCPRCNTAYTYHQHDHRLRCHHCEKNLSLPSRCPQCTAETLMPLGVGTERVEQYIQQLFPETPITRIDRDTTRKKGALESLLAQIHEPVPQILIGTQMLAKGHHFPFVTLVVIIDGDSGLLSSDFLATERFGQLLTQIAGRAGRALLPGKVLLQTRFPEHPLLQTLIHKGYIAFAEQLLHERKSASLPPFQFFALIRAESIHQESANQFLYQLKQTQSIPDRNTLLLGPIPAPMPKRQGKFRAQLLLQSSQRQTLHHTLNKLLTHIESLAHRYRVRWTVDVDPKEMF